jgi:hypothetical protein
VLRLIIAMAISAYGYKPKAKKNSATGKIRDALKDVGLPVDDGTILGWLREGADLLQREQAKRKSKANSLGADLMPRTGKPRRY